MPKYPLRYPHQTPILKKKKKKLIKKKKKKLIN